MIITAISDTHGNSLAVKSIENALKKSDLVLHLGDHFNDIDFLISTLGDKLITVHGNCDGGGEDKIIERENIKILITHGDKHGVKMGLTRLYLRAQEIGSRLVFYGHTHIPRIDVVDGITFVNPGCMTGYSKEKSYAIVEANDGIIKGKIINLG